jgi:Tfp pilus assembly protein PilF
MLERAVDLDPGFADAWGLLASACTQMGMYLDPDPKWLERAEQAIARTLELDPLHCDAFCARGMILWTPSHGFQHRPALRALNASIRINPSRYLSHGYRGIILSHLSTLAEAEKSLEEAIRVNPGYAILHLARSYVALYRGDYSKAEEYRDHALAIDPAQPQGNANWAEPPIWAGQLERAREKVRRARQMVPDEPQVTAQEGLILAREGDFKRAEQLADEVAASKKSLVHMHHSWHNAAGVYAMCGKPEKAMAQLKRSAEFGLPSHVAFGNDPHLRSLREYPEFIALQSQLRRDYDALREEFGLAG